MRTRTWIAASIVITLAGCAAAACSASGRENRFDDETDGDESSGHTGAGGGLDITSGSSGIGGGGILGTEPPCNGIDPNIDNDKDGWTGAQGDCNDCTPLMNAGAQDFDGNNIDDDCNGAKDDNPSSCDGSLPLDANKPEDAARAMGLCKSQGGDADRWGLISAEYIKPDGSPFGGLDPLGHGILDTYGPNVNPQEGKQMFVLSSGTARRPGDPGYYSPGAAFPGGYSKGYSTGSPPGYPKEAPACPGTTMTGIPYDGVGLKLRVKTPTNAKSLRFNLNFYTYEFPDFICSSYNDYYVSMLSPIPVGQLDGNISYDSEGNTISVNAGFLQVCHAQQAGMKDFPCPLGPGDLTGTGFDEDTNSAATGWLQTTSPLTDPGGEIELQLSIWDSGDGILDSTILLDKLEFIVDSAPTQTEPVPEPK